MNPTVLHAAASGETLQDFLASRLGLSRNRAKALLDTRSVFVNRRRVWMARHPVEKGDVVEVAGSAAPEPDGRQIRILHEDRDFLVADKPAGILANGPASAELLLREARNEPALRAAHRLDRDTSGCLLVARGERAFDDAVALFRGRQVHKVYRAIVAGPVERGQRDIDIPLDGLTARTSVRAISVGREASYLEVAIETGRTHQIRRHLAILRHPVLGDREHWTRPIVSDRQLAVPRQMLHAYTLAFPHPSDGRTLRACAPLPRDFRECLARFGLAEK